MKQYTYIAERVDLPIIIYNIPSRTGVSMTGPVYEELAKFPNINGVKEASGDFALVNDLMHRCGDEMNVWAGNEPTLPYRFLQWAVAVSYLRQRILSRGLCRRSVLNGLQGIMLGGAAAMQRAYYDVLRDLFLETNPIPG